MGTADTGKKLRALVLAVMIVSSVAVQPVGGQVIAGGTAAANTAGNAPAVVGNDATLDVATDSTLQVAYNVGNQPTGDYTVALRGDSGLGPLDQTTPSDGQQGTVNLTVPAGVSKNFTATVLLNRSGSVEATDNFAVTVTNVSAAPPSAAVFADGSGYDPATTTQLSAGYNASDRAASGLSMEVYNVTNENGTRIARNDSLPNTNDTARVSVGPGALSGDATLQFVLFNGSGGVIASDTAVYTSNAVDPASISTSDREYDPTTPTGVAASYDTGGRSPGDLTVVVANVTGGNDTVVATNASLSDTTGVATAEVPVGNLTGNATVAFRLVNASDAVLASTTVPYTTLADGGGGGGGGGETAPPPAVSGPQTTQTYADDRPLRLELAYTTGGRDPANYELRVVNATNGNGTVVTRNTSLTGTNGEFTFEIPASLLSGDVELDVELVNGTVVARNATTFLADVAPPTADVAVNVTEPTAGETVRLDAVNVSDDTGVTEYFWSVTRRGQESPVAEGRGTSIEFTPQTADEYTVVLGLRDEGGRFVDTTIEFRVTGATLDIRHPEELGKRGRSDDPQLVSNRLTIQSTRQITFDRGERYVIDVDREGQDAVSLVATERVSFEAFSRFALELQDAEGERIEPLLTTFRNDERVEVPLSVVSGGVPNESGVANYSVTLRNASTDATVASTDETPMVFDYAGELNASVDNGTVTFSIPRSSLGDTATARLDLFTGEPFESEGVLDGEALRYDAATDTYRTTVPRANLSENAYGYRVSFTTAGDGQFDVSSSFAGPVALKNVRFAGTLRASDGSRVNGTVTRYDPVVGAIPQPVTDGSFAFTVEPGTEVVTTYFQTTPEDRLELVTEPDGVPDIAAVGAGRYAPDNDTSIDATLREPSLLNLSVVDEDGDPVERGVSLAISPEVGSSPRAVTEVKYAFGPSVSPDGEFVGPAGPSGVELVGNVTIEVAPLPDSRFVGGKLRRVTMDRNRTVRIELDEEDEPPTARLATNRSNPLPGQAVRLDGSDSTDNDQIVEQSLTVTTPDGGTIEFPRATGTFTPSQAGEYTVTLTVTDRAGNTNTTQTTVDVRQPADVDYDFTLPSVVAGELAPDEPLVVEATVTNDGDVATERTVALRVDGSVVAERTVSVGADATETVQFSRSLSAGTHTVSVNEQPPREITVLQPATFAVNVTAGPTTVFTGEPVTVTAEVTNTGGTAGTTTVPFVIDGERINRTVSVPGGETRTVSVTTRFDSADPSTKLVRAGSDRPTAITVRAPTNPDATLSVRSPRTGTATDASVSLAYNVTNVDTGIDRAVVSVDDGSARTVPLANGTATVDLSGLTEGEHTVTVSLIDNFGSSVETVERTVVLDTGAPNVTLESTSAVVGPDDEATLNATVEDAAYANATARLYAGTDTSGTPVETTDLTDRLADGAATVPVDAVAGTTELDGTYTLEVVANDSLGRSETTTSEVEIDTTAPSVTVSSVDGGTTTGGTTYLNGSDTLSVSGSVSDGGAASVASAEVVLVAQDQAFEETVTVDVAADGSFDADVDVGSLSLPQGAYDVNVTATDTVGNTGETDSGEDFTFDDAAPSAGVSVIATGANQVRVVVTSNETIAGTTEVTLREPDGTTQSVQVTDGNDDGRYDATTSTTGTDGIYTGSVTVQDPAGNADTASSATNISTVAQFGADGNVTIETGGGTFVELNPEADTASGTSLASLTSSDTPLAALTENVSGDQFIEGEFGGDLSNENLTSATIGIPTNQIGLLDTVPADQLQIRRYNETTDTWNQRGTTRVAQNFDPDGPGGVPEGEYLLVTVTKFSTYGAVQPDTEAPTLDATAYSADTTAVSTATFPYDTDRVTTTFDYFDDVSGVDASAVVVKVNGNDVDTLSNASASITDSQASVTVTGVAGAGEKDVTVTVVDETGKSDTFTRSFTVETDDTDPTVSSTDLPATGLAPDTRRVPVTVDYTDPLSGVDTSTVSVTVGGTTLDAANVTVDDTGVSFTVGDTKNGLLSPGDSRSVSVSVTDAAGNTETISETVSVATDESGPTVDDTSYTADTSPVSGTTYPAETSRVSVELSISDEFNGVDSGAITVRFGPQGSLGDVTGSSLVTSSTVNYTATSLTPGTTYELNATLVDGEGNTRTVSRTVTVQPDTTAPRATSVSVTNVAGTTQPPFDNDVDGVSAQLTLTDNLDAVAPGRTVVEFGPEGSLADVTGDATVSADAVSYTNTDLQADTEYVLRVTVEDTAGNTRQIVRRFTVGGPPTARLSVPNSATEGETVQLDASASTDVGGTIASYEWDVDDDGQYEETTASPTLSASFFVPGEQTVRVRVVDSGGFASVARATVDVSPRRSGSAPSGDSGSGSDSTEPTATTTPTQTTTPTGESTADPTTATPGATPTDDTPAPSDDTATPSDGTPADGTATPATETPTDTATSDGETPTTAATGTATTAASETTAARGPGFGSLVAVVALLAAALLALRRE